MRRYKKYHLFIMVLIASLFLLSCAGCSKEGSGSNIFDARNIELGEVISGMVVESVEVFPASGQDEDVYLATVRFRGEASISGRYISHADQPLLGRIVLFYPDEASLKMLPRLSQDTGQFWLQIENYGDALRLLGAAGAEGQATIIIDEYTINYSLEVVHTAKIRQVTEKKETWQSDAITEGDKHGSENTEQQMVQEGFDARETEIGDIIAGMQVVSVETTQNPSDPDDYWATVEFKGQAKLEGTYKYNSDHEFLGDNVSFIVDVSSSDTLPKLENDTRYSWLVFKNIERSQEVFGPPGSEGTATIVIEDYVINYYPSEVYNTADLVEVIEKSSS